MLAADESENEQNAKFMVSMIRQCFKNMDYEIKRLMGQELTEVNYDITRRVNNRNFVTVGSLISHAGISDMEFIKSSFIIYVGLKIVEKAAEVGK